MGMEKWRGLRRGHIFTPFGTQIWGDLCQSQSSIHNVSFIEYRWHHSIMESQGEF